MDKFLFLQLDADIDVLKPMRTRAFRSFTTYKDLCNDDVPPEDVNTDAVVGTDQFMLSRKDTDKLLAILPQWLTALEVPRVSLITINGEGKTPRRLPRHRDMGREAVLNWYIDVAGERTEYDDASFVAERGDFVLMNSQEPHSVYLNGKVRKMVSFSYTHHTYNEILEARHAYN